MPRSSRNDYVDSSWMKNYDSGMKTSEAKNQQRGIGQRRKAGETQLDLLRHMRREAGPSGLVEASMASLGRGVGICPPSIQKALRRLVRDGRIEMVSLGHGRTPSVYRVVPSKTFRIKKIR